MNDKHLNVLYSALIKILKPLTRILLRNGVSFVSFAELAKWVYVDVATKEFAIKGRKQSTSRVSIITGLSRREVMRVRKLPVPYASASPESHNRAARVIAAWRREKEFLDVRGIPKSLPFEGKGVTFSKLVQRFSGNVPPRAVLDELLRVGAVERGDKGNVALRVRAYIPERNDSQRLDLFGTDVGHLLSTIDWNLDPGTSGPLFQRKVAYDNLPEEILPKFRSLFHKKAQALLENADRWLAQRDRDVNPDIKGSGRHKAGFGIFFFEEPFSEEDN